MRKGIRNACCLCRVLLPLAIWFRANAADATAQVETSDFFAKGHIEMAAGSSVMFSPFVASTGRPTFNYATAFFQTGYMLNEPKGNGVLRGNCELVGEAFAGGFFIGRGHYITGTTVWLRYNLLQPAWRVTPYAQLGGGVLLADIDQKIAGQTFNFNLDAAAGVRYFVNSNLSLNLEYRFQHISNANIGNHNLGLNAQGPVLSLSWAF